MIGYSRLALDKILALSAERGRDGFGSHQNDDRYIANFRAEPTTEYVKTKHRYDQQPYRTGSWAIIHNGTIANDKELRTHRHPTSIDSAAIVELLAEEDMLGCDEHMVGAKFQGVIEKLKGSYAIIGFHERFHALYVAVNYQALWYAVTPQAILFASARQFFPRDLTPRMIEPYSTWMFRIGKPAVRLSPAPGLAEPRCALVVASGGLDSTVVATKLLDEGYEVELLHFLYGSRAQGPELRAVKAIANHLSVPYHLMELPIYRPADSPLLRADSQIAGGEAGAEFAYEWVPARNLVMIAIATAMAEARGIETIALGNNIEEAGAYPDNVQEFIARVNDMLPFAVADGKRVRIIEPVGNLTKREIVKLGNELKAPIHLTWSCYRAGVHHCGTCGPCYMRRIAHQINGLTDPVMTSEEVTS
jgi:7-cyano-7-deazaguanine synthase